MNGMYRGQKAGEFCLPDENGKEVCLKTFLGMWVVLYVLSQGQHIGVYLGGH